MFEDPDSRKYLQLEGKRLCFKISVGDKGQRSSLKKMWHERLLAVNGKMGLRLVKPARLGSGATMTVACLSGDYRALDESGVLDMPKTVETLRAAERVLVSTQLG